MATGKEGGEEGGGGACESIACGAETGSLSWPTLTKWLEGFLNRSIRRASHPFRFGNSGIAICMPWGVY